MSVPVTFLLYIYLIHRARIVSKLSRLDLLVAYDPSLLLYCSRELLFHNFLFNATRLSTGLDRVLACLLFLLGFCSRSSDSGACYSRQYALENITLNVSKD